jgi:predicted NAD/FAD-binding protein
MRFVADFLGNHRMLQRTGRPQWRVVRGGSRNYLGPLVEPFRDRLRLGCPVRRVLRTEDGVRVATDAGEESFDEVVIAGHADQALRMLADPSDAEREVLGAFPYQENAVTLHADPSVLPRRRRAWGSWNFHRPAEERDRTTVTYCMNLLQSLRTETVFNVTLNEEEAIDPARVLRRLVYSHPVYARGRAAAQARHGELIRARRTSFCGAYFGYGFHEDGVRSARKVAEAFGRSLSDA